MKKPSLMSSVNKKLNEPTEDVRQKEISNKHYPIGSRSNFIRATITLPPNLLKELKLLGIEKKLNGEKDYDVSSLIRKALIKFLNDKNL